MDFYSQQKDAAYLVPKTEIEASFGQMNTRLMDQSYSVSQSFNPFVAKQKKIIAASEYTLAQLDYASNKQLLVLELRQIWDDLEFHKNKKQLLEGQQVYWLEFAKQSSLRYEVGESSLLEKTTAEVSVRELAQQIKYEEAQLDRKKLELQSMLGVKDPVQLVLEEYHIYPNIKKEEYDLLKNKNIQLANQRIEYSKRKAELRKAELKPDFNLGYFIQSIQGPQEVNNEVVEYDAVPRFQGVRVGVAVPVFRKAYKAQNQQAQTEIAIENAKLNQLEIELTHQIASIQKELEVLAAQLEYYEKDALPNTELLVANAEKAYSSGDIDYLNFVQALNTKTSVEMARLETIKAYNKQAILLRYYLGQ